MAPLDRKTFKTPPPTVTDKSLTQETRRVKALEEQKRRRALKIDAARQFDRFAALEIGSASNQAPDANRSNDQDGIAQFVPLLENATPEVVDVTHPLSSELQLAKKKGKSRRKPRTDAPGPKPSKWADKCMYAELLELSPNESWACRLPEDLEIGWAAVGPVPVGKRCLAVTHQSSGMTGVVPNTTLHSRLLGKSLLRPFPSSLPPSTILDCILDENWRENGILHVLDCVKWKEQDVGDCETQFRLWWRDTRLCELPPMLPPPRSAPAPSGTAEATPSSPTQPSLLPTPPSSQANFELPQYRFPYPTTLLPVPYHAPTPLPLLASLIIPSARSVRDIEVKVPLLPSAAVCDSIEMDIDSIPKYSLVSRTAHIAPDGLLLYVSQAAYESGTSPLCNWIPISQPEDTSCSDSPSLDRLDLFERLVHRRIALAGQAHVVEGVEGVVGGMEVDA